MQVTRKRTLIAAATGSLATIALAGALIVPVIANAQDPTPTVPATPGIGRDEVRGDNGSGLAEALGITVEELTAAREAAADAAIDEAVAQGLITETQAEQLRLLGRGDRFIGRLGGEIDEEALLADALGVTGDELNEAQNQVFEDRVAEAVEAGAITQERADLVLARRALLEFLAPRLEQAYEDGVAAAVDEGVITQEQADLLQSLGMGGRFGAFGGRGLFGPGGDFGEFGSRGGHGGRGCHGMRGGEGTGFDLRNLLPGGDVTPLTPDTSNDSSLNSDLTSS